MDFFKDLLRVVALFVFAYAVYANSVAAAIAGSALYTGGFGDVFALKKHRRPKAKKPELKVIRLDQTA